MRTGTTFTLLASLAAFGAAQSGVANALSQIPQCAQQCFIESVQTSGCGPLDTYCQCTTGQQKIAKSVTACLCQSDCSASDLEKAQSASNNICEAALSASGETYTATSAPADACGTAAAGGSSGSSMTMGSASASATPMSSDMASMSSMAAGGMASMSSMAASSMAAASSSAAPEQQSGNAAAPAATGMAGAVMGVVGLGLMAL